MTDTTQSAESALKPCPFCGNDSAVLDGKSDSCRVRCESCGTEGRPSFFNGEDYDQIEIAEEEARFGWNMRDPSSPERAIPAPAALSDEEIDSALDDLFYSPMELADRRKFARTIERLSAERLRAAPPAEQWQPIETAPRRFSPPLSPVNHHAPDILGLWGQAFFCVCRWGGPSQPYWIGGDNKKVPFQPTHWMPLPPPPIWQPRC